MKNLQIQEYKDIVSKIAMCRNRSILFFVLFVLLVSTTVFSTINSNYINTPLVTQEETNWCWAASSLSILNYYGIYTSQSQYVTYVKTGTTSPIYDPNVTATVSECENGLDYFGVSSTMYYGSLSFSTVKSEVGTNNRPIFTAIRWLDSNNTVVGGHAVVIDGYYEYTNEDYQEIRYMDP